MTMRTNAEVDGGAGADTGLDALRSLGTQVLAPALRLRRLAALERSDILVVVVYAVAIGLVSLAVPVAAQSLVNTVAFTALTQPVVVLATLVFVGLVAAGALRTLQYGVIETLQQRFFVRATHDTIRRLTRADLHGFSDHGPPELVNRFFDVATIQKAASTLLMDGLSVLLQGTVSLVLLAFYHPALLAFDVVLIALLGVNLFTLGRGGVSTAIEESKAKFATAAWLEEMAAAIRTLKASGAGTFAFEHADGLAQKYVRYRQKHFGVLLRQIVASYLVQALATAVLLGVGGFLVIKGELTLGQLVAAELIVTGLLASVAKLGKYLETYYDLAASVDKLGALVDLPEERADGVRRAHVDEPARLELDDVTFSYEGNVAALDRVSLALAQGDRVAVLGGNASGKSTLVDLLYGLRSPTTGQVKLDGLDVRTLSLSDLRRDVAIAGRAEVFDASVLDNLRMGREHVDAALVGDVLERVALSDEIAALPGGTASRLGHAGSRLTSSQASRLTIARALVARPRLLVIDEALDGLGLDVARTVLRRVAAAPSAPSLLVLTSSAEIAREVGRVVRLDRGVLEATTAVLP